MATKRPIKKQVSIDLHDHTKAIQEWNIDLGGFEIYLTGEEAGEPDKILGEPGVEFLMSTRLIKNLQILASHNQRRPILVHMKTCGGIWEDGMAIYDALRLAPNPIVILNYTHARSMSSIIFQAAQRRVMMPNSYFMFHRGTLLVEGTFKNVVSNVKWQENLDNTMCEVYARRMKERGKFSTWSIERIKKMLAEEMDRKEDAFLTAQEAFEWGLADSIFDGNWGSLRRNLKKS